MKKIKFENGAEIVINKFPKNPIRGTTSHFDYLYPLWKCPSCEGISRFLDTFGEFCSVCGEDHTLNWQEFIIDSKVKENWKKE